MKNYTFDTVIKLEVLKNYLSRAATAAFLIHTKTLSDDLRAIKNLGIKFLGRHLVTGTRIQMKKSISESQRNLRKEFMKLIRRSFSRLAFLRQYTDL